MKFSLLMANYNSAKYIDQAIQSVLEQSCPDWELIIVDDASTDDSIQKLTRYKTHPQIHLHRRETNGGYGLALRDTARNANGDIYGIIDSDDTLHKDALKIMHQAHQDNPDRGLIYSQFMLCDKDLKPLQKGDCGPIPDDTSWLDIILNQPKPRPRISHFKTFKRTAYEQTEGFHALRRTVDKDIVLKLEEITKTLFIDKVLYYYRTHPAGISRDNTTKSYGDLIIRKALKRRK